MLDRLFVSSSVGAPTSTRRHRKGAIIGTGEVGMACAFSMLIQNTFDDLVLIDPNPEKVEGEVMDLVQGLPFVEPVMVRVGTLADCAGADLVIITAGSKRNPGERRLDYLGRNFKIFQGLIPELARHCQEAILLIVTNPVDVMTYVTWKLSGLPSTSIIGSGTILDTARFRYLLAQQLQLHPHSVHAYIIGEHGDSQVPCWSQVNVAGIPLLSLDAALGTANDPQQWNRIFEQVKEAAYEIIKRKGPVCYAIALGVTQLVQTILHDQHRVLTVSCLVNGLYGIEDVYLSLPAVVNRQGISRIVQLDLNPLEEQQLKQSAQILRHAIEGLAL
jgi:L-lactate dehydrogenase